MPLQGTPDSLDEILKAEGHRLSFKDATSSSNPHSMSYQVPIKHAYEFEVSEKKRADFDDLKAKFGKTSKLFFHGSLPQNFHSIIRNSLKNYSGTANQTNGAFHGNGIYMGKDFFYFPRLLPVFSRRGCSGLAVR